MRTSITGGLTVILREGAEVSLRRIQTGWLRRGYRLEVSTCDLEGCDVLVYGPCRRSMAGILKELLGRVPLSWNQVGSGLATLQVIEELLGPEVRSQIESRK